MNKPNKKSRQTEFQKIFNIKDIYYELKGVGVIGRPDTVFIFYFILSTILDFSVAIETNPDFRFIRSTLLQSNTCSFNFLVVPFSLQIIFFSKIWLAFVAA